MFRIRLKTLREERGYSQYTLADILGVSQSAVGSWESGVREPKLDTIQRIADFFGVTVDYLMGRTDDTEKKPVPEDELKIKNVKFIGRDGTVKFKKLTPEMISMLEQLPDSDEDL